MELFEKLNAFAKTAADKTNELVEDTRLKTQILNDEKSIRKGLEHIFLNADEIIRYKENLKNYAYNNEAIQKKTDQILGLDKSEKI